MGFGWLAAQHLMTAGLPAASETKKAQAALCTAGQDIIFCYMSGGVSQVDSFDEKPLLKERAGQPMPVPVHATMFDNVGTIMPSPWEFRPRGESGLNLSDLFPAIADHADHLCVVRSMTSKANEHAQEISSFTAAFRSKGTLAREPG